MPPVLIHTSELSRISGSRCVRCCWSNCSFCFLFLSLSFSLKVSWNFHCGVRDVVVVGMSVRSSFPSRVLLGRVYTMAKVLPCMLGVLGEDQLLPSGVLSLFYSSFCQLITLWVVRLLAVWVNPYRCVKAVNSCELYCGPLSLSRIWGMPWWENIVFRA